MGITALALVAPGDTITSAQQNIVRTDFTVLDARTGGDPGAAGKLPVSDGAASAAWTVGYPAIIGLLGYRPVNEAGDAMTGDLGAPGFVAGAHGVSGGSGGVNGGSGGFSGGSTSAGVPNFLGINVGTSGIASAGPFNPASYSGGSTSVGVPNLLGINVGTSGIAISGQINSSVPNGTPPFVVASATQVSNLNAFMLQGIQPTATPTGSRIPISDSSGLLDSWVSPSAGAVPSGMGCLWSNTIASIPAGWSRWTAMNGRIPVSAGSTFSTTFVEGTSYGTSWSHNHSTPSHNHSGAPLSVSGTSSSSGTTLNGRFTAGGATALPDNHTHPFSASVAGNTATDGSGTSGDTAWVIPMFAVVAVTKN